MLTRGWTQARIDIKKNTDSGLRYGRHPKGSGGAVNPEIAKMYNKKLVGVKAICSIEIKGISSHALSRLEQRGISPDVAYDLLVNAAIVYPGNTAGTICQQKDNLRVVINENTGNIVTFIDLYEED